MEQQKPSTDWPKRNNNLNGDEHLLRQNPVGDDSSLPKEERIPVDLISDYVISKINITETLTDLTLNGNFLSYFNENGDEIAIDLGPILGEDNRPRITQGSFNNINSLLTLRREDNSTVIIDLNSINADLISLNTGNVIARYVNQQDNIINIEESVTSLTLDGSILSFNNEAGNNEDIDLSGLIGQSRIIQGDYAPNTRILTLTRDDNSFIDIDLTDIVQSKSSIVNTIIGNLIATHNNGDGVSVDINETITNLELNGVILSYDNEAGQTISYDLTDLSEDINLSRIISGSISGNILTLVRDDGSTIPITLGDFTPTISTVTAANIGKTIAIHDNGLGTLTAIQETITNISLTDNILSYTNETGIPIDVDLSTLLDDTNLERIEEGEIVGTNIILTRGDDSTITIPLDSILNGSVSQLTDTITGHPIAIHNDGQGNNVTLNETITNLTYVDYILRYTREDGSEAAIDLSGLQDDETQPFINSAFLNENTYVLTLQRTDTSRVTVDLSVLKDESAVSNMDIFINGSAIAQHDNGDGQVETIYESITSIIPNSGGTYTYINELGLQTEIGFNETLTQLSYSGDTLFYSDENENIVSIALPNSISIVNSSNTGKLIATHDNGIDEVEIYESITSLQINETNLIYTKEDGTEDIIDLTAFLGETQSRIESGEIIGNNLILTREPDQTQVIIPIGELFSSVINTISGNPIAEHISSTNNVVINESITSLELDVNNNLVYDKEGVGTDVIDLSFLDRFRIETATFDNLTSIIRLTRDDQSFIEIDISSVLSNPSNVTGTIVGNPIAVHDDGTDNDVTINETITSMVLENNTLTYTKEGGGTDTIDLSAYVGENLPFIESGAIVGNNLVLTRDDDSFINIEIINLRSSVTNTIAGNTIATHTSNQVDVNINESITSLTLDENNILIYDKEGIGTDEIDLSFLTNVNIETVAYDTGVLTITLDDASFFTANIPEGAISSFSQLLLDGHIIGEHDDGNGVLSTLRETITELSLSGVILTYTDEEGTSTPIDLSALSEEITFARIISGEINEDNELVLTRFDGSTVIISLNDFAPTVSSISDTLLDGHLIATHDNGLLNPVSIYETVTELTDNLDGTYTYTSEDDTLTVIDTNETVTTISIVNNVISYVNEDNDTVTIDLTPYINGDDVYIESGEYDSLNENLILTLTDATTVTISVAGLVTDPAFFTEVISGHPIAIHNDGLGNETTLNETVTSISITDDIITYNDEAGTPTTIDLSSYVNSTDLYLTEGVYIGGNIVLTLSDDSTVSIDVSELLDNTYVESGAFIAPNILRFTNTDASTFDVDISDIITDPSSFSNVQLTGKIIARHNDGLGNFTDLRETITLLSISNDVISFINENNDTTTVDLSPYINGVDVHVDSGIYDEINNNIVLTMTDSSEVTIDLSALINDPAFFTGVISGHPIAVHDDGQGNETTLNETITDIGFNQVNNILSYTKEDGITTQVDLSSINTNDSRITSATWDNTTATITFHREADGSSFDLTLDQLTSKFETFLAPTDNHLIGKHTSGNGTAVFVYETTTSVSLVSGGTTLRYIDEKGSETDLLLPSSIDNNSVSSFSSVQGTGKTIAIHDDGEGNTTTLRETVTNLDLNFAQNGLIYTDENGDDNEILFPNNGGGGGTISVVTESDPVNGTANGRQIATHNDGNGNTKVLYETVTELSLSGSILTYVDELGASTPITLPSGGGGVGGRTFTNSDGVNITIPNGLYTIKSEKTSANSFNLSTSPSNGDTVIYLGNVSNERIFFTGYTITSLDSGSSSSFVTINSDEAHRFMYVGGDWYHKQIT